MSAAAAVAAATAGLRTVPLDEVIAMADLQTRTDRKYLIPVAAFEYLLLRLGARLSVLAIEGRSLFRYESVYFDTGDLLAYHLHAHDRRRRFKVRTRAYLDSGACVLEVKTEGGRGETVKDRLPYAIADRHTLTPAARTFAGTRIADPALVPRLRAAVTTTYHRATLVDLRSGSRLTADVDLLFAGQAGSRHGPPGTVLVETKSIGAATPADALLWRLGHRPVSVSKYCVGLALLHPSLPANRWHRELRTHFGWSPAHSENVGRR